MERKGGHHQGKIRAVRPRAPVDVTRAARPRKHHSGKKSAARRSSAPENVRVKLCHGARRCRQQEALEKTLDGRIDGMIALLTALSGAPLRTAGKFDVEALIG